ncbi:MAG: HAD hydrolase-like protein [Pseudomonadota bacterium]
MTIPSLMGAEAAFHRYEAVRARLPQAAFPEKTVTARNLTDVFDDYDGFVLDAFGVLNVGETPIEGAAERVAEMRKRGKHVIVLTNAASYQPAATKAKFERLGFDFSADEIVSSRATAASRLGEVVPGATWAGIAAEGDDFRDIDGTVVDLFAEPAAWEEADGFLFLSSFRWDTGLQDKLVEALKKRPRPVVVANPDLVAPYGGSFSTEPGHFGHDIADRLGVVPRFIGKPFPEAFTLAQSKYPGARFAMVGDTLHTDVLGGKAAGMGTILVTDHGLFAGLDAAHYVGRSGIIPDVTVETT